MTAALLLLHLTLGQATPLPPPPPSPPPLMAAPGEGEVAPLPPPLPPDAPTYEAAPRAPAPRAEDLPPPRSKVSRTTRVLVEGGTGMLVGLGGGALAGLAYWVISCNGVGTFCGVSMLEVLLFSGVASLFLVPTSVAVAGRLLGGRGSWGWSLLGTAVGAVAGGLVTLAATAGGQNDVHPVVFPIVGALMLGGGIAGYELISYRNELRDEEVRARLSPGVAFFPGGASLGLSGTF